MTTIGDGGAVADDDRDFAHHQLAVQLVDQYLAKHPGQDLRLFDVGCGRGQMIRSLKRALDEPSRQRIRYLGYDADQAYAKETKEIGLTAGLLEVDARIGELSDLAVLVPVDDQFGLICLTNTLHEVNWPTIPTLLLDLMERMDDGGNLFVYDVETESPPELGAIAWRRAEIERLIRALVQQLGSSYEPTALQLAGKSSFAWAITIDQSLLGISGEEFAVRRENAAEVGATVGISILEAKLHACTQALEALTTKGAETVEEESFRTRLLFDYWAIQRAKDGQ